MPKYAVADQGLILALLHALIYAVADKSAYISAVICAYLCGSDKSTNSNAFIYTNIFVAD